MSESPEELGALLTRAQRMSKAADALVKAIYERYVAALDAAWADITDEEILASEERKLELCQAASAQKWAHVRVHRMLPDYRNALMHLHQGEDNLWRPTYQLHLTHYEGRPERPHLGQVHAAIQELAANWAMGRRLITFEVLGLSLGESGQTIKIEYEPATNQGRLMGGWRAREQLTYGPLAELLIAAQHTAQADS